MADIEKVIKGLEELEGFLFKEYTNIKSEESKIYYDRFKSLSDAIELLKQKIKTKVVFGRTKDGEFVTECGNCGTHLDKAYSNCPKCNKELDWNSNQT